MNVQRTNGKYDSMGLLFIKFLKGRHHSTDTLTIDQWISVWRFDIQYIFSRWLINTWFRPPLLPRWYYIPTSYSSTFVIFKCQNLNYHRRKCKRLMIWCWGRKRLLSKKKMERSSWVKWHWNAELHEICHWLPCCESQLTDWKKTITIPVMTQNCIQLY